MMHISMYPAIKLLSLLLFWQFLFSNQYFKTFAEEGLTSHAKLAEWIRENGGTVHYEVTKLCPTCVRGAYATKDIQAGDIVALVPFNVSIRMPPNTDYSGGHAYELIKRMYTDPGFNKTYGLFWSTQPSPEDVLSAEVFTDLHMSELQSEFSREHAYEMREHTLKYYNGTIDDNDDEDPPEPKTPPPGGVDQDGEERPKYKHINDVIAPHSITPDTFLYVSSLIVTREFTFDPHGIDGDFMYPSIDMLNDCLHGHCNVERTNDDDFARLIAVKDIKKGDELRHAYQSDVTHRPDMSLLVYGFTMPSDPPLMAAQDLPDFDYHDPFQETEYKDDEYMPESRDEQLDEVERCEDILDGFLTTAEEDEAILKSGKWDGDWKIQEVIKSRLARKKALMYRIKMLTDNLSEL